MTVPATVNEHLSESAQRQLSALREALETRLAALEDVLADPSRGESLEGLILDLSRVATEEAQAAAATACLDTQVEADRQIAEAWTSARATLQSMQAALDQEREAGSDLRRALDQAQQHVASLERDAQAELRSVREQFEAEAKRARAATAYLQRAVIDARTKLETDRASSAASEQATARAEEHFTERIATLGHELAQARAAHEALVADLSGEREAAAALERAHAETQSHLAETTSSLDETRLQLEAERAWRAQGEAGLLSPAPAFLSDDDEWRDVRLANRYVFREQIEVQIDGDSGRLYDLSICGCQIQSRSALKPNQVVTVLLPSEHREIGCTGKVVWVRPEPPATGRPLRYRAGVRFTKADESAIEAFAARLGATAG